MTTQEADPRPVFGDTVPVRMCIGCRTRRPQQQLVRCTWRADGPTISRTSEGRGAWLCSMECFETALRRKAFPRAWRRDVPSSTLEALRIPLEGVITNMRDLAAAGNHPGTPMPTKG